MEVFFKENYPHLSISFEDKGVDSRHFWFDIIISSWNKTKIRFTYDNSGQYFGVCHIDLNNKVDDYITEALKDKFKYGKSSQWWPWYGMLNTQIPNSDKLEMWNSIDYGEFTRFVELWFVEVIECTKDLEM